MRYSRTRLICVDLERDSWKCSAYVVRVRRALIGLFPYLRKVFFYPRTEWCISRRISRLFFVFTVSFYFLIAIDLTPIFFLQQLQTGDKIFACQSKYLWFFCVLSLLKTIQRNSLLLLFTYHSRKLVRKMQVVEKFIHWLQVSRKALYVFNQQLPFSFPFSSSVKLTSSIFFLFLAVNAWCVRWNSVSRFRPVIKDCFYLNVVS